MDPASDLAFPPFTTTYDFFMFFLYDAESLSDILFGAITTDSPLTVQRTGYA